MISELPNEYHGHQVCSDNRKRYYMNGIQVRFEELLFPAYIKAQSAINQKSVPFDNEMEEER